MGSRFEGVVEKAGFSDGPSAAAFEEHVRGRFPEDADARELNDLHLVFACVSGSKDALRRLGEMVTKVAVASRKVRVPDDTIDDARQIVFERLIGPGLKIDTYDGRGPLGGWLRVTVAREALYLHRARERRERDASIDEIVQMAASDDVELAGMKEELRSEFRNALGRAARSIESRERALLRQHFVLGMSVDVLGPVYGVHRATAARWIAAAKEALLRNFYSELQTAIGIPRAEAEKLWTLVQSRFDISLGPLLQSTEK